MRIRPRLLLIAAFTFAAALAAQQSAPVAHIQAPPPSTAGTRTPDGALRVSGGVMAGQIVKRVWPSSVPCNGPTSIYVMHAIIGTDGKIERLDLISGPPNPGYVTAVMNAVRQWEYKPYLLNGTPVKVDTTITVDTQRNGCPS
jgi:TonB-like protein